MKIAETMRTGFAELWGHKTRSLLSFFAISIGTAAFMYTFSTIAGISQKQTLVMNLAGPGRLNIENKRDYAAKSATPAPKLTYDDVLAIRRDMPWLYMVSPKTLNWGRKFLHNRVYAYTAVEGITTEWLKREWVYKLRGRFITDYDLQNYSRVCVLIEDGDWPVGKKKPAWAKLWNYADPVANYIQHTNLLGQDINLDNHSYRVVGIIKKPPEGEDPRWFVYGYGEHVLLPITTMLHFMPQQYEDNVREINVDTGDPKTLPLAQHQITVLLKNRHANTENFTTRPLSEMFSQAFASRRKQAMTILAIGIVAILAGGIGIMNVTLATVFSRIKEIGIRRAIGATRRDILMQFVTEAMLLGLFGGFFGIGLGYGFIQYATDKDIRVFLWWVPLLSVFIAVATGFLFSLYPAYTAAKLDPVESLRYE